MKVLVAAASRYGATQEIAERLAVFSLTTDSMSTSRVRRASTT
jgi:menaquinone-dependent protoporphyrinogen IX oxidase